MRNTFTPDNSALSTRSAPGPSASDLERLNRHCHSLSQAIEERAAPNVIAAHAGEVAIAGAIFRRKFEISRDAALGFFPAPAQAPIFSLNGVPIFEAERSEDGISLFFTCPKCGRENSHGACGPKFGEGDGHRGSHCQCWANGYYIVESGPDFEQRDRPRFERRRRQRDKAAVEAAQRRGWAESGLM